MSGPLIHTRKTTRVLMSEVLLALTPITVAAVWRYGWAAMGIFLSSILVACAADWVCTRKRRSDGSAIVIGVIFALLLPAGSPWWLAALGSAIAVFLGKYAFGGMGQNAFNPAALSLVVLMGMLPTYFFAPRWTIDGVSMATPLSKEIGSMFPSLPPLLAGGYPGTLGEAAPWAVLVGGLLLILLRTIDWRIPLTYLAAIAFFALVLPAGDRMTGHAPWLAGNPLLHLIGGGSFVAAFFMLTDPVTAPFSTTGRVIFAILAGTYTIIVRFYTPFPDGAALAVLLANAAVPLIDKYTLDLTNTIPSEIMTPAK